jgi:hypothetical protein
MKLAEARMGNARIGVRIHSFIHQAMADVICRELFFELRVNF